MSGIKHECIYDLEDIVTPTNIYIKGDSVYVFDKVNADEGILYKFNRDFKDKQFIVEVDDGECYFGKDGFVYILYTREKSFIEIFDLSGNKIKELTLSTTAYYIDVDEKGFIYTISPEEEGLTVNLYDSSGRFIRLLHSRDMPIITSILPTDDGLYMGGLCLQSPYAVQKINHMSYIEDNFELGDLNPKSIISRLLKYGDNLFVLISGQHCDGISVIDEKSKQVKDMDLSEIGVRNIYDMFILDGVLYILDSGKRVVLYRIGRETTLQETGACGLKKKLHKNSGFGYIPFIIFMKDFPGNFLNMFFKAALPFTMLFMLYTRFILMYSINRSVRLFSLLSILLAIVCVFGKNIFTMQNKRLRVDTMLDMYNRYEKLKNNMAGNSVFMGLIFSIVFYSGLYKSGIPYAILVAISLLLWGLISISTMALLNKKFKRFKNDISDTAFELLSLNMKEHDLLKDISGEVKTLRKSGIEKYRIKILTDTKIGRRAINIINKWSGLRAKITGDSGKLKNYEGFIIFELNLKNRDIKYSRVSLIEDFVCYIKKAVNISSVIIENCEEKVQKS
jgi:Predicted membrane-associated HD superfamily hydrolase